MIFRVDDRLIHGQVIIGWVRKLNLSKIIVVDDNASKDPSFCMMANLCCPEDIEIEVFDIDSAVKYFQNKNLTEEKTIVLFGSLAHIKSFIDKGINIKKINLGGIHFKQERKRYCDYIYLSQEEINIIKELLNKNIAILVKAIPDELEIPIQQLIKSI